MTVVPFPGYVSPSDALIDAGVMFIGNTPVAFGATRGGIKFDPGTEWRTIEYDGGFAEKAGLQRKVGFNSELSGKAIEFNAAALMRYEPGSTSSSTDSGTLITPMAAGHLLQTGDYLQNVQAFLRKQGGGVQLVTFAFAYVKQWDFQTGPKTEAEGSIVIRACLAPTETNLELCPYTLSDLIGA